MGELLDRGLQHDILQTLSNSYPNPVPVAKAFDGGGNTLNVNLAYLEQHELVDVKWHNGISDGKRPILAAINARGLDFIADDGGLSAILGVVTIKLHDDTIRALLISKIQNADGNETVKKKLIEKVKDLPADALGMIATAGLEAGLDKVSDLLGFIGSMIPLK